MRTVTLGRLGVVALAAVMTAGAGAVAFAGHALATPPGSRAVVAGEDRSHERSCDDDLARPGAGYSKAHTATSADDCEERGDEGRHAKDCPTVTATQTWTKPWTKTWTKAASVDAVVAGDSKHRGKDATSTYGHGDGKDGSDDGSEHTAPPCPTVTSPTETVSSPPTETLSSPPTTGTPTVTVTTSTATEPTPTTSSTSTTPAPSPTPCSTDSTDDGCEVVTSPPAFTG